MSDISVIPPGGGEVVGDSPERRVEILSDHETLAATWSRLGSHRDGADLHVHREHSDLFYVLEGEFTLRLGMEDEPVVVPAGKLACVPPMVVHGFRNGGVVDVRYLNFHAPGMQFAKYLRSLRDGRRFSYDQHEPPADGGRPTSLVSVGESFKRDHIVVRQRRLEASSLDEGPAPGALRSFFVLDGADPGTWLQVPPGASYTLRGNTHYLELLTPGRGSGAAPAAPSRA
jgi:mannose-6-phosphate isomerase-like protein (cupin superfamily)